jgi:hypothetical protein
MKINQNTSARQATNHNTKTELNPNQDYNYLMAKHKNQMWKK